MCRKALDGPAMRPPTPQVTENSVGEQQTHNVGAKRLQRERACGDRPPPKFVPSGLVLEGAFCFQRLIKRIFS
jgi:hypothetical protein